MKHPSFEEEKEWRLISNRIDEKTNVNIDFYGNKKGIIPYYKFKLTNEKFPLITKVGDTNLIVVTGPSIDVSSRNVSLQFLLNNKLGSGCGLSYSQIPYKTW